MHKHLLDSLEDVENFHRNPANVNAGKNMFDPYIDRWLLIAKYKDI